MHFAMVPVMVSVMSTAMGMGEAPQGAALGSVEIHESLLGNRQETAISATVPYCLDQCRETGKIGFFEIAGGLREGEYTSPYPFDDSDVYKTLEGMANVLAIAPSPERKKAADELIAKVAAAQEEDGYVMTWRRIDPDAPPVDWAGDERWGNLAFGHELYNMGHLIEAGVAHFEATGERTLLGVAERCAGLVHKTFAVEGRAGVPGHEEIELALCRLYQATGERRHLDTALHFLEARGREGGTYDESLQGHKPVAKQREAVGHVVRAMYLYTGMGEAALLADRPAYEEALGELWRDIVGRKLYLTGGMGSDHRVEGFAGAYELPNREAYCETCGAIGSVLFNHRMFRLERDAKYLDVLERSLFNCALSGMSADGKAFFYRNPLEADAEVYGVSREPWFTCACCPTNLARFVPALGRYLYAQGGAEGRDVYLTLYGASTARLEAGGQRVVLRQETDYPWDGTVRISVEPESPVAFRLFVRIPGWAMGRPVPSDLYRYAEGPEAEPTLYVNGKSVEASPESGFVVLDRVWQQGDTVKLELPMQVHRVAAHEAVAANRGKLAVERGPVVYSFEDIDNTGAAKPLVLPPHFQVQRAYVPELAGGVWVLSLQDAQGVELLRAIPYFARAHRGVTPMRVWVDAP